MRNDIKETANVHFGYPLLARIVLIAKPHRDNQLRGRCARQGDPGTTRFFASLEDTFFHARDLPKWLTENPPGPQGVIDRHVSALIAEFLQVGEDRIAGSLEASMPYEAIVGEHRRRFVEQRDLMLVASDLAGIVKTMVGAHLDTLIQKSLDETKQKPKKDKPSDGGMLALYGALKESLPLTSRKDAPDSWRGLAPEALKEKVHSQLAYELERILDDAGPGAIRELVLKAFGVSFAEHMENLAALRDDAPMQALGQDPKIVFSKMAGAAWQRLIDGVRVQIATQELHGVWSAIRG